MHPSHHMGLKQHGGSTVFSSLAELFLKHFTVPDILLNGNCGYGVGTHSSNFHNRVLITHILLHFLPVAASRLNVACIHCFRPPPLCMVHSM